MSGITYIRPDGAPDDWAEQLMNDHLNQYHQYERTDDVAWRDEPALSVVPAARPSMIETHPDNRPYSRIVVGEAVLGGQYFGAHPVEQWLHLESGEPVTFDLATPGADLYLTPRSVDDQIRRRTTTPSKNTLDVNGETLGRNTQGILQPAPTVATSIHLIGRESRRHGTGRGILEAPDIKTYLIRTDPEAVVALIRKNRHSDRGAARRIAEKTGLSERTVRRRLNGQSVSQKTADRLLEYAYQQALFEEDG